MNNFFLKVRAIQKLEKLRFVDEDDVDFKILNELDHSAKF